MRIGINSGAVVAGVIGRKRFLYDHGIPDRIQVTRATRDLLGKEFDFEPRGNVAVRGHHDIEAYLLLGRKAAAATVAST